MRRPHRLRTRIVVTTALVSVVVMAAMIATVVLALSVVTRRSVDSTLVDRFSVLQTAVARAGQDPATALETTDDAVDDSTWLYGDDGHLIDGPHATDKVQDVAEGLADVTTRTRVVRGQRVYFAAPVKIGSGADRAGVLVVSTSLEPYRDTRTELILVLSVLGLLVAAGTTGIAAWTVTRTLEPVQSMAALAADWSTQQLDARFDDRLNDDEITRLGSTLNLLLDRVEGALRTEQRLTSELAHELRTPLTAIRGEAELAMAVTHDGAVRERMGRVVTLIDRMGDTITTLLDLARGGGADGRTTTVSALVHEAVDQRPESGIDVVVDAGVDDHGGVRLSAGAEIGLRALAPLVDNAANHATSRVVVGCEVHERFVVLTVSDDGTGLPAGDPEQLFPAGVQRGAHSGAGLGLALARRAARSLGGDATVRSPRAPTVFALTLPRS